MLEYSLPFISFSFLFEFLYFLITFAVTVLLPGLFFTRSLKHINYLERFLFSISVGLAILGLQAFFLGYLQLRWLTVVYVLFFSIAGCLTILSHRQSFTTILQKITPRPDISALLIGVIGTVTQLIPVWFSGFKTPQGISFFQINAHDGVFHLSVIQSLINSFPPMQPGAIGLAITNYHFWSDLIMAEFVRLWGLHIIHVYFHFFPLIISPLLGLTVYLLVKTWTNSRSAAKWGLFFLYFSGDMNYFFMYLFHRAFNFSSVTIDNGAIQFINMPQAFAKLLFLVGLLLFHHWHAKKNTTAGLWSAVLFSTLAGFKIYFGMVAAFSFSLSVAVHFSLQFFKIIPKFSTKTVRAFVQQQKFPIMFNLIFAAIAAAIYFPVNKNAGGLFWAPFAWPKLLLHLDKLNWQEWWLRMQVYEQLGTWKHVLVWHLIAAAIFFIAIYSVRMLGLIPAPAVIKKIGWHNVIFIFPAMWLFTFLGINTLQTSGTFNIFNFFVVVLTLSTLTSAVLIDHYLQKIPRIFAVIITFVIIAITIPRVIGTNYSFLKGALLQEDVTTISNEEIEALNYIKKNTPTHAIVQAHPGNNWEKKTPYISFFTNRYVYFGGKEILLSHNQPIEERDMFMDQVFKLKNPVEFSRLIDWTGIDYIYIQKPRELGPQRLEFKIRNSFLSKEFENTKGIVIKNIKPNRRDIISYCTPKIICEEW